MTERVPMHLLARRLMSDQLTPVLAYRRLVAPDDRTAPSFLFESVENGATVGRWSMLGAQPVLEVLARGHEVEVRDRRAGTSERERLDDPLGRADDIFTSSPTSRSSPRIARIDESASAPTALSRKPLLRGPSDAHATRNRAACSARLRRGPSASSAVSHAPR